MDTINVYKMTSTQLTGGAMYVGYRNGRLSNFDVSDAQPTDQQLAWLVKHLPPAEADLARTDFGTMIVELIPAKTAKDKLILFSQAFRAARNVTYVATQQERSNIRVVPVTPALLKIFFSDPLSDFSIANYIRRINITKDRLKNGNAPRMPNTYDIKYEATLVGNDVMKYHMHLTALGWKKLTGGPAGTVWRPPVRQQE